MKTKSIVTIAVLIFSFLVLTSVKRDQEKLTFTGVYDGHEDYGYNFIGQDEDGEKYTMTFQDVEASLLKSFDLSSDALIGTKFIVTFTSEIEVETDEDGYEDEIETNTIVALKKL